MASSLPPTMAKALEFLKNNSFATLVMGGLGGVVLDVFVGIGRIIEAMAFVFSEPIFVVTEVATGLFRWTVGGPITFLQTTAKATGPLLVERFGFLSFIAALVLVYLTLRIVAQILEERATSNLFPGTFTDFPLIGTTEEGETDEE